MKPWEAAGVALRRGGALSAKGLALAELCFRACLCCVETYGQDGKRLLRDRPSAIRTQLTNDSNNLFDWTCQRAPGRRNAQHNPAARGTSPCGTDSRATPRQGQAPGSSSGQADLGFCRRQRGARRSPRPRSSPARRPASAFLSSTEA